MRFKWVIVSLVIHGVVLLGILLIKAREQPSRTSEIKVMVTRSSTFIPTSALESLRSTGKKDLGKATQGESTDETLAPLNLNIIYPQQAKEESKEGMVTLEVYVNSEGRASDIRVLRSSGINVLDEAAITAFENALFEKSSKKIRKKEFEVQFKL